MRKCVSPILLMLSISILLSTTGCSVVRFAENRVGYGVKQIDVLNTETRENQLNRRDFDLGFNASQQGFSVQLRYRPYYGSESRDIVRTRARITALDLAVGLVSAGAFGWIAYDNWTGSGVYIPDANGDLKENVSLNWGETALWEKAVLVGVPIDFLLSGFLHTTTQEFTMPWETRGERAGTWEIVQNHPYRIELPNHNFSKEYWTTRDARSISIREFLEGLPTPDHLLNIKTLELRASAKDEAGKPLAQTLTLEDARSLRPFHRFAQHAISGIDVRENIPRTSKVNRDAVAVVIGNSEYLKSDVPSVDFALDDANIIKEYLLRTLGYNLVNIIHLENATKGDFERVFGTEGNHEGRLFRRADGKDRQDIFIYYSGHGAPDLNSKEPYLVPVDADPGDIAFGGYPLKLLYQNLNKTSYRQATVVIDSCFSGMSAKGQLIRDISGHGIPVMEIPQLSAQNSVIFTATNSQQGANWYGDKEHSLFTYFFLKAMQGEANTNGDQQLTAAEIAQYVAEHVPQTLRRESETRREQTPQIVGNENLVIVQY